MDAQGAACRLHKNNHKGETGTFGLSLMPMSGLTIEDTWFGAGMKGTGSNTIVAKDVFVPEHRFLPYPKAFAGSYRTEYTDEIVYRVALVPVTILILVGSQLGMAQAALDYVVEKAPERPVTHTNYTKQRESTGFQILLADAAMKIETARLHAYRAADDLDACAAAGRHPDVKERARVRADSALVAKYCREAAEILASAPG